MENVISMVCQRGASDKHFQHKSSSTTMPSSTDMGILPLRLAKEGEWVRIVSINGGKGLHERLAGVGLRVGTMIQVLRNPMDGKLLIGHEGARLYLGGGMALKIHVTVIEGENQ